MNILQYMLGLRLWEGGVVRAVIDLCEALAARGHGVTMVTTDDSDAPHNWGKASTSVRLERIEARSGLQARLTANGRARMRELIRAADVVHLHVPWDPICAQVGAMCRAAGKPYVLTVHGMLDDWTMRTKGLKKRVYLALRGRRLLEGAAAVHVAAEAEREQSAKWYPRGRTVVAPLPFDLAPFGALPTIEESRRHWSSQTGGEPYVTAIGRLDAIKRLDVLIKAVALARRGGTRVRLLLAGTNEPGTRCEEDLKSLARASGVEQAVVFLGFVGGDEKLMLYRGAAATLTASVHESFGYSVIESLACGTPVVLTRAVNIWPEVERSGIATIVEPAPEAFALAMAKAVEETDRRRLSGTTGRAFVEDWLGGTRVVERYEAMYAGAVRRD